MGLIFEAVMPPAEKILLLALADEAAHDGGSIFPGQTLMMMKTSMGLRSIQRHLAGLVRDGILIVEKPPTQHQPAHYRIDLKVVAALTFRPANLAILEKVRVANGDNPGSPSPPSRVATGGALPVLQRHPSTKSTRGHGIVLTDDAFIAALKLNPAYEGIEIDRELGKLDAWLMTPRGHGKQKTRQRIVNWLNRAEKPIKGSSAAPKVDTTPWFGPNLR